MRHEDRWTVSDKELAEEVKALSTERDRLNANPDRTEADDTMMDEIDDRLEHLQREQEMRSEWAAEHLDLDLEAQDRRAHAEELIENHRRER